MSKEFVKGAYTINISKNYEINIHNNTNNKNFYAKKDLSDFVVLTSVGFSLFEMCNIFFDNNSYKIQEEDDNVILTLLFGSTSIIVDCKCNNKELIASNLTKELHKTKEQVNKLTEKCSDLTRKMLDTRVQLMGITEKYDELQKYVDSVCTVSKYIFIGQTRINKYKKHLMINIDILKTRSFDHSHPHINICSFYKKHDILEDYKSSCFAKKMDANLILSKHKEQHRPAPSRSGGGGIPATLTSEIVKILDEEKSYNHKLCKIHTYIDDDIDNPVQLDLESIDIEDIIQMDLDILTICNASIRNVHLLKNFKGRHLTIYMSWIDDTFFEGISEHTFGIKTLCDVISQMEKLTTLTLIPRKEIVIKLNFDFFEKLKSLRTLIIPSGTDVRYKTGTPLTVYYSDDGITYTSS